MLARGSAGGEVAEGGAEGVPGPSGGGREGISREGVWEGGSEAFEQAGGRAVSWADAVLRICEEST
jgi:hypothetical protein